MKNKTTLVQGIIICAQGILFDVFSLYAAVPLLCNLWFGDLYSKEKTITMFSLAIWIGVSIGAAIAVNIGKKKIFEYFTEPSETINQSTSNNYCTPGSSIFRESNAAVTTPSKGEWKCPKCGKINSNLSYCIIQYKKAITLHKVKLLPEISWNMLICEIKTLSNPVYIITKMNLYVN